MLMLITAAALATTPANERALYAGLCERVAASFDSARGGFVERGVPCESAVELGLILGHGARKSSWTARSLATIAWTRGLRDTVGGGFLLGAAQVGSAPAEFLKRTDSNARRLENLVQAWRLMADSRYRAEAAQVVDYMDRVLLDGRGGFLAGQTADIDLDPRANGYAIRAWLSWAAATGDLAKRDFAARSLDRVWETCWVPEVGLIRRGTFGEGTSEPQLADQAEMGRALVLAARLIGRGRDAARARALGEILLHRFADPEKGGFRTRFATTRGGKPKRAPRVAAENARAALFLCELGTLSGEARYRVAARGAWSSFGKGFGKAGLEAADWALALRAALEPELPVVPRWPRRPHASADRRSISFRPSGR
ncbi:MAG TPA: hypothetical protein VGK93_02050 [Candidatus Eisenbacteria bacterium]|jgi:uncharacterized protein YyaL (SSP411 family)